MQKIIIYFLFGMPKESKIKHINGLCNTWHNHKNTVVYGCRLLIDFGLVATISVILWFSSMIFII